MQKKKIRETRSSSSHWLAGLVCAYLAYASYHRWFSTAETAGTSLVHSFVEELAEVTKQRYAKFDGEAGLSVAGFKSEANLIPCIFFTNSLNKGVTLFLIWTKT